MKAKHVIVMNGQALHDRNIIESNNEHFEIFKIPREETKEEQQKTDEWFCEQVKRAKKIHREQREQQDIELIQAITGCDKGSAIQKLMFYKRRKDNGSDNPI